MKGKTVVLLLLPLLLFSACGKQSDVITVQHVLIAFEGTIPGKEINRTKEEAAVLAAQIFGRAKKGEDFDALVKEYTDDSHPGIYKMANFDVPADPGQQIFERGRMVKAFGDIGFGLGVDEVGLAVFHPDTSKYGWHIIKRLE